MSESKILIVEDDKSIQNLLQIALKSKGYDFVVAEQGAFALSLALSGGIDLVLLDLGLPDMDGLEVLGALRKESQVPVIIISARGLEREKVEALDGGANDYVTKPFQVGELLARIRAALRIAGPKPAKVTCFSLDGFKMDYEKRKVFLRDEEIHLTPIEYKILSLLTENAGKVLTHKFLQEACWGYETGDEYQSLRVFVANIRRKLEKDTAKPRFLLTEIGVGYRFVDE